MSETYFEEQTFEGINIADGKFIRGHYEYYNYSIDPDMNRIKKAQFSIPGVIGLLNKYDIVIK